MARTSEKPWYRESRKAWYMTLEGEQIPLGKDARLARIEFHRVMEDYEKKQGTQKAKTPRAPRVKNVHTEFLSWVKDNRAERTFDWYDSHIKGFEESLGANLNRMKVIDLNPNHVYSWVNHKSHKGWGTTFKRGAIVAIQRVYNWASRNLSIPSPLGSMEKPTAETRDNHLTQKDFDKLMTFVRGKNFRDLLEFVWATGCRPQELRAIEADFCHLDRKTIEFPVKDSKGKKAKRVILLQTKALELVKRLMEKYPDGPIFRNEDGNPWTAYAINCNFQRISKRSKLSYALYDIRHSFCQRMLESGIDHIAAAEILGHRNAIMIAKVYSHMAKAHGHLRSELRKLECTSPAAEARSD